MLDGNFKAELLRMRNPDDDVSLFDGKGFMVESTKYQHHLAHTPDAPKVQETSPGLAHIRIKKY